MTRLENFTIDTEESPKDRRAKGWVWTKQFGQDQAKANAWCDALKLRKVEAGWHCAAVEKGSSYHVQGTSWFPTARTREAVKKRMEASWAAVAKGTAQQNRDYVMSEGKHADKPGKRCVTDSTAELGTIPCGQGKRTDLSDFVSLIDSKDDTQLKLSHPNYVFRYPKLINAYRQVGWKDKKRDGSHPVTVTVLCGDPGTGKSTDARNILEPPIYVRSGQEGLWWSGYAGEPSVILEEFDPGRVSIDTLKTWLDKWPCMVSGKGEGYMPLLATSFVITCQNHPSQWYPKASANDNAALARRMKIQRRILQEKDTAQIQVKWRNYNAVLVDPETMTTTDYGGVHEVDQEPVESQD